MTADVCMWHTIPVFLTVFYCYKSALTYAAICNRLQTTPPTTASQKIPPRFSDIFHKRLRIFNQLFTHLLQVYVPTYAILQIFIHLLQLWQSFAIKAIWLCHIEHDYLVHIICSKCPPSAEKDASDVTFANVTIALLIVICGKSSQIFCCSILFSSGMVFRFDWSLWNAWSIAPHRW